MPSRISRDDRFFSKADKGRAEQVLEAPFSPCFAPVLDAIRGNAGNPDGTPVIVLGGG